MNGVIRIRGAGVVCALGVGAAAVAAAVDSGKEHTAFQVPSPTRAAYPAPFEAQRDLPRGVGRRLGRQLAMSLAAVLDAVGAERAWRDEPDDTGIVGATAHGPIDETVEFVAGVHRDGARYASPRLFSTALHSSMAGIAAQQLGIRGPSLVVSNGDVSFETALLVATAALAARRMKRAIVVGADAFHPLHARSLSAFNLLSDSTEPVDPAMLRTTRGLLLGEGAGALVLDWDEGGDGVRVESVSVGAGVVHQDIGSARVHLMATGDVASVRRHSAALSGCGVEDSRVEYPAARFGAFPSLSAVAIAVEAARRLHSTDSPAPTLFVTVPHGANAATVLLSGRGAA